MEGHGITQVFLAIGHPAAVETYKLRVFGQLFNLIEKILAYQDA